MIDKTNTWWEGTVKYAKQGVDTINYIDFSEAKFRAAQSGKRYLQWKESVPFKANFKYKEEQGLIYFEKMAGSGVVTARIGNTRIDTRTNTIIVVRLGAYLRDYSYSIGDIPNPDTGDSVLERYTRKSPYGYNSNIRWYKMRCAWSGEDYEITQTLLKRGVGSPYKNGTQPCSKNNLNLFPEIIKYLKNPDDAFNYTPMSEKEITCICPDCRTERKYTMVATLTRFGFSCRFCTGIISYGERYVSNYLDIARVPYEQYKRFEWLPNREYDFYLPTENLIIETHGEQHYKDVAYFKKKEVEQQLIDSEKRSKAQAEGFNYVEINSSEGTFEGMSNSTPIGVLPELSENQRETLRIRMRETQRYSNYQQIVEDFVNGMYLGELSDKYKISKYKCRKILKHEKVYERRKKTLSGEDSHMSIKVRCVNTGEVFITLREAAKWAGVVNGHRISLSCKNKNLSSGKHPETGEPLKWEYVNKGERNKC